MEETAECSRVALEAYRALGCRGFGRVDVLLDADGTPWVLEVNTIPGFTPISMYPRLMEHAGVDFAELTVRLVADAMRRAGRSEGLLQAEDRTAGLAELSGL